SVVVNPAVNTTYTVTGSNGSCTGTQTISISITSNVTYTLGATATTVCPGQTVGLTVLGGVNYTWSPGSSLSTTTGSATTATPLIPTTYSVVGNDGAGCNGSGFITINMGSAPNVQVVSTASAVCTGFSATLTASGATSYTWTGSTFTAAVNQTSVAVGPGTYTLKGSNGSTCASQTVITIGLAPPLNVVLSQNTFTTCVANNFPKFSKPVQLSATGASSYNWFPCNQFISICLGPVVQVRPPTSTCYTVTGNSAVCSGSAVICVTVIPQYTITVKPPIPIMCTGDSIVLKVANIGSVSIAPFAYSWADPEPISLYNPLDFSVTAYPTNTTSLPRTITYTTEVLDSRGCISVEKLVTVTVVPRPTMAVSIPTINGVPTNTVCFVGNSTGYPNVTLNLCANNTNSLPPQYDPTFTWVPTYTSTSGPIISANPTNGPQSCIIVSAPQRTPTPVTFTVVAGWNGIPGCREIDTVSVISVDCRSVTPFSFTTATVNDTICSRQCVTFLAPADTTFGGPMSYTWTFSGGNPATSNLKNPTVCYNLPGKFNVLLQVCNPYPKHTVPPGSCYTRGYLNMIKVVDIPNPRILPKVIFQMSPKDTIIRFASSIVLTATNASSYVWDPPYNISPMTGSIVTVHPLQTTQYHVTAYNSKNCYSTDTINVIVIEDCGEMFVPNAFSPNADGMNDVLHVRGQCLETLTFMIFNRWGEKVFETNDKNVGWDGTYKGELMNTGVFVFRLEGKTYDGKAYTMKGNITLVR
ncbi:MAG: gliding motility-associated C-terminal domain-containing protein, partial [Bacteroidetes bacterium]|nr:gliding motility-associated C-terminal domain-containing protein [Bacteroidota bacterium]